MFPFQGCLAHGLYSAGKDPEAELSFCVARGTIDISAEGVEDNSAIATIDALKLSIVRSNTSTL